MLTRSLSKLHPRSTALNFTNFNKSLSVGIVRIPALPHYQWGNLNGHKSQNPEPEIQTLATTEPQTHKETRL